MGIELDRSVIDIGIVTRDAQPMLSFYRDLIGLSSEGVVKTPSGQTMHRLGSSSQLLKIIEADTITESSGLGITESTGFRYITFWVKDIEVAVNRLRQAGCEPLMGPLELRAGLKIAMFNDPDANCVELAENRAGH